MNCPRCRARNLRSAKVCSNCGEPLGPGGSAAPAEKTVVYSPDKRSETGNRVEFRVRRSNTGGVVQAEYTVAKPSTVIGRTGGDWSCPDDGKLSRNHAELVLEGNRLYLQDLKSTNGTYVRLPSRYRLSRGDCVLIGNELFRVNLAGAPAPAETEGTLFFGEETVKSDLTLMDPRGSVVQEILLRKDRTVIGRGKADLSFPQDSGLAEQHAAIVREPHGLYLEDLGSARGNFLRVQERVELREGDKFLVGDQVLHIVSAHTAG